MTDYVPLQIRFGESPYWSEGGYGNWNGGRLDGWRVLAISMMLNRTGRGQVETVLHSFFTSFPFAAYAETVTYNSRTRSVMTNILRPLGFQHVRTKRIGEMSKQYLDHEGWRTADKVHLFSGCGEYATDAWRIFVERDYSVPSGDEVLEAYRRRALFDQGVRALEAPYGPSSR